MGSHQTGTVLSCSHGDCGCRVRIEAECHCPDVGQSYRCTCGAPMTAVNETSGAQAHAH